MKETISRSAIHNKNHHLFIKQPHHLNEYNFIHLTEVICITESFITTCLQLQCQKNV